MEFAATDIRAVAFRRLQIDGSCEFTFHKFESTRDTSSESSILVAGCGGCGRMWCARLVQMHHQTRE